MTQQEPSRSYTRLIDSTIENIAYSISRSIESQDWDGSDEKVRNLVQLMGALERYEERTPTVTEVERLRAEIREMHTGMDAMGRQLDRFLKKGNFWARMIPLFLVAAAVVYPLYGMVTHMPPQSLRSVSGSSQWTCRSDHWLLVRAARRGELRWPSTWAWCNTRSFRISVRATTQDRGALGEQPAGVRRQFRADLHGEFQVVLMAGQFLQALGGQRGGRRDVAAACRELCAQEGEFRAAVPG